jgi:hypothetical protein
MHPHEAAVLPTSSTAGERICLTDRCEQRQRRIEKPKRGEGACPDRSLDSSRHRTATLDSGSITSTCGTPPTEVM